MWEKHDKIQHPVIIKTLNISGIEGNMLNLIKEIHKTLQLRLYLIVKDRIFPLTSVTWQRFHFLITSI